MSRTNRTYWSDGNWREARKGGPRYQAERAAAWAAEGPGEFSIAGAWAPRGKPHGGMLMSPSNTGFWGDEFPSSAAPRRRRIVKRAERQRVAAEIAAELLSEDDTDPFYAVDDSTRDYEDQILDDFYGSDAWSDAYSAGYYRDFEVYDDWMWRDLEDSY